MSADSQKRVGGGTIIGAANRPTIVPPQAVSDRSIIESVAGFINDVTLANNQQHDVKDHILWVRFETTADLSDPCAGDDWDLEGGVAPPLLLILGYSNGIQVWAVPANGEAIEVLSWRHGNVKCLRILPTPVVADCEQSTGGEAIDQYAHKRPLIAICDSATHQHHMSGSGGGGYHGGGGDGMGGLNGTQHCSMNLVSLKDGDQVKSIKFKTPIIDILANRSSIVVTFLEKIAVFDARTLEDRLTVTTCFASPGLNPNPVALGSRWMAYAEKKLLPSKRSNGGCDCGGVQSYTATVLNAAKSLGKGLRELGEHVAAGLTGQPSSSMSSGNAGTNAGSGAAILDAGVGGIVTILDVKYPIRDISPTTGTPITTNGNEAIIAHFIAHTDPIVALAFDFSGMLLLTADKRGHNFHIFRIHPHPSGAALAAVHHLYVLHRGDTTAKVQDIAFSMDSRWVAVSTMRGTTHIFPVTSYGGPAGVRTHATPHVVNRLSRFHRSAGLSIETGRSSSPVSFSSGGGSDHYSSTASIAQSAVAYQNPRQPPFPHPTVVLPLAQIRQPTSLGNTGAGGGGPTSGALTSHKLTHSRQRHSSTSDDALGNPLRVAAYFAKDRSWLLDPPGLLRDTPAHRMQRRPVDSLFIMAGHGALIQYDLDPRHASNIPKEKVCDDTPIELDVVAKAQWHLQRTDYQRTDIQPPLLPDNWLIKNRLIDSMMESSGDSEKHHHSLDSGHHERDDRWLAQVEIMTHAGPHRRLWMGPQFMFKTYNTPSGSPLTAIDIESVEIGATIVGNRPARSNPMNMPGSGRSLVPVLIESGSCSSFEQSPRLMDTFRHEHLDSDFVLGPGESQLREDLADAMREPSILSRETGGVIATATTVCASSNPMTISLTSIASDASSKTSASRSIAKLVNPLGTVTTVTANPDDDLPEVHDFETSDRYLHENCDEALFRPVVTVMDVAIEDGVDLDNTMPDIPKQASVATELIVPVIDETFVEPKKPVEAVVAEKKKKSPPPEDRAIEKFEQLAALNRKVEPKEEPVPRKLSKGEKEKKPVEPELKKAGKGKKEKTPPPKEEKQPTPPKPESVAEKPFEKEKTPEVPKPMTEKEVVPSVSIKLPTKKANKKNRKEDKQPVAAVEELAPVKLEEKAVEQPPEEPLPPVVKSVWNMASPFNIVTQLDAAISEEDIPDAVGAWGRPKKNDCPSPVFDDFPTLQPLEPLDKPEPVASFDFLPPPPPIVAIEDLSAQPTQFFVKLAKKPKKGKDPKLEVVPLKVEKPELLDLPPPLEEVDADEEPELIQLPTPPQPSVSKKVKGEEEGYAFFNPDELVSIQESLFKDNAISLKKSGKASKTKDKPQFGLPAKSDVATRSKYEFVETDPFPPLEPLSPFAKMSFKDVIEDAISTADTLINLHSPEKEETTREEDASGGRKKTISSSSSIYEDPANLAMCSGLQSSTVDEDDKASKTSSENKGSGSSGGSGDAPDSDYKSLDLEIDEHYLDLESGAEGGGFLSSDENNKDSSDDTEELSCRSKKALVASPSLRRNTSTSSSDENIVVVDPTSADATTPPDVVEPSTSAMQGEDEELEPLISNVTTPSSTASPNLTTKAMINDTLPDALLPTTMTTSLTISGSNQPLSAGSKQQQQQQQSPQQQQSSSANQKMPVTVAATSSNNNNNNNNGKKKSRMKKKR